MSKHVKIKIIGSKGNSKLIIRIKTGLTKHTDMEFSLKPLFHILTPTHVNLSGIGDAYLGSPEKNKINIESPDGLTCENVSVKMVCHIFHGSEFKVPLDNLKNCLVNKLNPDEENVDEMRKLLQELGEL